MGCFCCFLSDVETTQKSFEGSSFSEIKKHDRQCTDVGMLVIFALMCISLFIISAYGFAHGDLNRIIYATDSFGNVCGRQNSRLIFIDKNNTNHLFRLSGMDLTRRKYAFPLDVRYPTQTVWICVESCPPVLPSITVIKDHLSNGNSVCDYDTVDAISLIALDFANTGPCPHPTNFLTSPKWNRCLAKVNRSMDHSNHGYLAYLWNFDFTRVLTFELLIVWKEIIGFCFLSMFLSLTMSLLLRFFYSVIVYVIFAVAAMFTVGLLFCMWILFANRLRHHENILDSKIFHFFYEDMDLDPRSWFVLSLLTSIFAIITFIFMLHLWPRRLLIIRLFKETNKTLKINPFIIFQPIVTFICLLIFLIFWSIVGLYLSTANVFMSKTISTIEVLNFPVRHVPILHFKASEVVQCFRFVHFLLLIWILEFIFAAQRMIIAGAVACAYFSRNEPKIHWPLVNNTVLLLRYHLGSIAFGSLVIFIFKIPRRLFLNAYQRLYCDSGRFSKCSRRILGGILEFFVSKLRPLHHNAFTLISVAGIEFCIAAQNASEVLEENSYKISFVNNDGGFLIYFAKSLIAFKIFILAGSVFGSNSDIEYWIFPTIICTFLAYIIANCFLSVYEMVFDTLFVCYAEEASIVDKSAGSTDFMDAGMRQFMNETLISERSLGLRSDGPKLKNVRWKNRTRVTFEEI